LVLRFQVGFSRQKVRLLDLVADALGGRSDAVQEGKQAAIEDLDNVTVTKLAVETPEQPLGLADVFFLVAAGDLTQPCSSSMLSFCDKRQQKISFLLVQC
jgi:hypothetical protein